MPEINNIPTTQYIGPKIIPHLWDPIEWSATTQYDALAIVQNLGDTYISRYIVPAGTPLTDDNYWVKFAAWNAQVAQYQATVETFDDRITQNTDDISDVEDMLPASTFENGTVADALDSLASIFPYSEGGVDGFDETHTVYDGINALGTAMSNALADTNALLPASSFTSESTVLDAINTVASDAQGAVDDLAAVLPSTDYSTSHTVSDAIAGVAASADNANDKIGTGFSSANTVRNEIDALDTELSDRYALFVGDSYLRGTGTTDGPSGGDGFSSPGNGWGKSLVTALGYTSDHVYSIGSGSAGFTKRGTTAGIGNGKNFGEMVTYAGTNIDADIRKRFDLIVICGGLNDGTDIVQSDIDACMTACRTYFNGVPVHVFTQLGRFNASTGICRLSTNDAASYATIRESVAKGGGSFHEMWPFGLGSTNLYGSDYIHLTDNGYTHFARAMKAGIYGGEIGPFAMPKAGFFDATAYPDTSATVVTSTCYYDGYDTVTLSGISFRAGAAVTTNAGADVAQIPEKLAPRSTLYTYGLCNYGSGAPGICGIYIYNTGRIHILRGLGSDGKFSTDLAGTELITMPPLTYKLY